MSEKRKQKILLFSPIAVLFLCLGFVAALFWNMYRQAAFEHISAFCEIAAQRNPELEPQILSALKAYSALSAQDVRGNHYLAQYGYSGEEFFKGRSFVIFGALAAVFLVVSGAFLLSARTARKRSRSRIAELTEYLEQVNIGAGGTLIQTKEDDCSRLQDELYKTVTMLYQTREAAVAARKSFAENLANIAHQLKTPITAAVLSLQLMKKASPNNYIQQIEKQLGRLNRLEESLLALAGIDAGTLNLKKEKVDVYTALNVAAENLNDLLTKEEVSVVIPDKGCIEFLGDLEWTMEALMNLLKNCMEHSRPGGRVHCDYSGNPLYAEILIWDEGAGFAPQDIPRLFERFYRGKDAAPGGIGIGLSLARSIVELQNGSLTARNLQSGGACFEIRIYSH